MRDNVNQAWGLQGAAAWQEVQVCAIVHSPTAPGAELLWPLSAQLQQLGYPVLVLDACQSESAATPGLRELLAEPAWQAVGLGPRLSQSSPASVAALPAAQGLRLLQTLEQLQPYARRYALVIVHAPAEQLAPLLQGRALRALLPLDMQPRGMVRNYRQIKHLALQAGLPCIVADTTRAHERLARRHAQAQMASLARCAQRHLGLVPLCTSADVHSASDMRRLALQLLAHAAPLSDPLYPPLNAPALLQAATLAAAPMPVPVRGAPTFSPLAWSQ